MFHEDSKAKDTIVFMHENAGNIGLRMDWFKLAYERLDVNIVAVAYRGYSRSTGTPTEEGLLRDAEAMVNFCKQETRINQKRVFALGRSLGGAVAIHTLAKMAKQSNPSTLDKITGEDDCYFRGLIIENTFSSISDMADTLFGFLKWIPNIKAKMLKLNWNSEEQI